MKEYKISDLRSSSPICEKIIYQIVFRTFTEQGTISAATEKLKHVASIGADIIYLSPFFAADPDENRENWSPRQTAAGTDNPKNPYRICDYYRIDEEYGTDEDLCAFVKEAHRLGLEVIFDLVYMHCGPTEFVQKHPSFVKRYSDGSIMSTRYNFPYLDHGNPELREYLWSNMIYLIEKFDVDGFRCDVGDKVPLDFWAEGRRRCEQIKPSLYFINEGQEPDYMLDVFDASYYNHDFSWNEVILKALRNGKNISADIRMIYAALAARNPEGAMLLRAYENHDFVNDSYDGRIDKLCPQLCEAVMVMNFLIDGVPLLYSGNEFAECRRHSIFRKADDRLCMDWSAMDTPLGQKRLALTKKLCSLRHSLPVLCHGAAAMEKDAELVVITRTLGNTTVRAVFSFECDGAEYVPHGGNELISWGCERLGSSIFIQKGGYYAECIIS